MNKNHKNNLSQYLKKLDKDIKDYTDNIPDEVKQMLMEMSYEHSKQVFANNQNDDFNEITRIIYRAYIIGMVMGQVQSKQRNEVIKEDNVIHLNVL